MEKLIFGILSMVIVLTNAEDSCPPLEDMSRSGDMYYLVGETKMKFDGSPYDYCQKKGLRLANVQNSTRFAFIKDFLKSADKDVYVNLYNPNGNSCSDSASCVNQFQDASKNNIDTSQFGQVTAQNGYPCIAVRSNGNVEEVNCPALYPLCESSCMHRIDGGWGEWSPWSECCERNQTRFRLCDNPEPSKDPQGSYCGPNNWTKMNAWRSCAVQDPCTEKSENTNDNSNDNSSEEDSSEEDSSETNRWSIWSQWSICHFVCGDEVGHRIRSRKCLGSTCKGDGVQTIECEATPCANSDGCTKPEVSTNVLSDMMGIGSRYYFVSKEAVNFEDAGEICQSQGLQMAQFHNLQDYQDIKEYLQTVSSSDIWLDMHNSLQKSCSSPDTCRFTLFREDKSAVDTSFLPKGAIFVNGSEDKCVYIRKDGFISERRCDDEAFVVCSHQCT